MRKMKLITAVSLITLVILGFAGVAYAQTQTPSNPDCPYGCPAPGQNGSARQTWGRGTGMMGQSYGMMGGRWAGSDPDQGISGEEGPLHDYMIAAMAEAFGITPEELESRHDAGETMWDIAQSQGLNAEQFSSQMLHARSDALSQAVADGVLSQEQADWMLSHMNRMGSFGYGAGSSGCPGMGGGSGSWQGMGRWNR